MKSWLKIGGSFIFLFMVFLVIMAPASFIHNQVKDQIKPAQLHQVSGTIWSGQAASLSLMQYHFSNLSWKIAPLKLFTGTLSLTSQVRDPKYPLNARISLDTSSVSLEQLKGKLPARMIPALGRLPDFGLQGKLAIDMERVEMEDRKLTQARGTLTLENATVNIPGKTTIGTIQANIQTKDQDIVVQLRDIKAPIGLVGNIRLKPDQQYTGVVTLTPRPGADPGVVNMLKNTGTPLRNGAIEYRFTGKL